VKASTLKIGKAAVLVCFILFVVLPVLVAICWAVQDWRYTRFCWRGQPYYTRIAAACDQVLGAGEPIPREIKGKALEGLPPVFRDLDVSRVYVETNLVMVVVGGGWLTHHIIWSEAKDGSEWNLIRTSPEARKRDIIYTRARPVSANKRLEPTRLAPPVYSYVSGRAAQPQRSVSWVILHRHAPARAAGVCPSRLGLYA
jgi:hypothetical protein